MLSVVAASSVSAHGDGSNRLTRSASVGNGAFGVFSPGARYQLTLIEGTTHRIAN